MNTREDFARRFKTLRRPGEKQGDFAKRLKMSQPTVALYETGKRTPDIETLARICRECGCSADWLIGLAPLMCRVLPYNPEAVADINGKLSETFLQISSAAELMKAAAQGLAHLACKINTPKGEPE